MVRRPPVKRGKDGLPILMDRCLHPVQRIGQLVDDLCKNARLRGSAYCQRHQR